MKKSTIISMVCIAITFQVFFVSCDMFGNLFGLENAELSELDIVGAEALFITPGSASASSTSGRSGISADGEGNVLYKITETGVIAEVTTTDENGDDVTGELSPTSIADSGSDYLIITYDFLPQYTIPAVLVRKTDGAVFSLDDVGWFRGDLQADSDGNLYYIAGHAAAETVLMKIDVSDPENLTATGLTDASEAPQEFVVTGDGHLAYGSRIRKASGGLHNLPGDVTSIWIGLDGNIKFLDYEARGSIFTVHFDSSNNVTTDSVTGTDLGFMYGTTTILRLLNRAYIVDDVGGIHEVENPTNTPRSIMISELDSLTLASCSSTHLVLAGADDSNNPILIKVDPETDEITTLLPQDGTYYDIFKMAVMPAGTVMFNALRMSDGRKVVGEIDADGILTILDEDLNVQVVSLERIQ